MGMNLRLRRDVVPFVLSGTMLLAACDATRGRSDTATSTDPDSMGVAPTAVTTVHLRSSRGLVESSGAAMSAMQPGVLFSINDSGNEAVLYAVDTLGADRGTWRVKGSSDVDWEAVAIGRCADGPTPRCVYIGDTGDNDDGLASRAIYRVPEPQARDSTFSGEVAAERITYTYPDRRHDVEAMYVASSGDIYLITKRPLQTRARRLRPALVFRIPANVWGGKRPVVAQLVDSLSLVPGSAPLRTITDAALSPDGRHLAVRTYSQVYIYATDPATGRVDHATPEARCDVVSLGEPQGEGITWADNAGRLVFSSEGHDAPLHLANCPLPR
jgi:hypothetical protein